MRFTVVYKLGQRWERALFRERREAEAYAARVAVAFRAEYVQVKTR